MSFAKQTLGDAAQDFPFKVKDAEFIPSRRYYDEEFFKLEGERLWPHVWQMTCRLEEIPQIGDWVEYKILDKSIIIVRTREGVKAFDNACRHRGVQLASGHGNCEIKGFVCPFHGWRYDLNGENTFVFERKYFNEDVLKKSDLALTQCRVELWGGCAFINFDDNAPSLAECLGPALMERLDARNVEKLKVKWWHSAELPCNWKLAMEAFMEGYHVMRTHPQLQSLLLPGAGIYDANEGKTSPRRSMSSREYVVGLIDFLAKAHEGMAGLSTAGEIEIAQSLRDMELPEDLGDAALAFITRLRTEITKQGRERGIPVPDLNEIAVTHPIGDVEFMFPHYFLLSSFSAMSSYRVRPLGPEACLFEMWQLELFPEDEVRAPPVAPLPTPPDDPNIPEVPRQDYSNLPLQQLGMHARGLEYLRLSKDVEGMISNYQRLIDGYLAGVDPVKLARATQIVGSGYDAPIRDLGF